MVFGTLATESALADAWGFELAIEAASVLEALTDALAEALTALLDAAE